MEPDKFRASRQAINRLCENLNLLIQENAVDASRECFEKAEQALAQLKPQAEGEIQKRSVKNLGMKINYLKTHVDKLKTGKSPGSRSATSVNPAVVWDEEKIQQLAPAFLSKVLLNMGDDTDADVCFGTTGKGIRPSYQIRFADKKTTAFSGNNHKPLAGTLPVGSSKLSSPFPHKVVKTILNNR